MIRPSFALAIVATLAGCSRKTEEPGEPSGSATTPTPVAVIHDAAPPVDGAAADGETVKQHMNEHFAAITELQRAIAHGRLEAAQSQAQWIVDHEEPGRIAAWAPLVTELKQAAREVVAARDVPTASALAARLGRACSRCHEQNAAVVSFAWEQAPPEGTTLAAQMKRHQWAAQRLWEGLVAPIDDVWREGATVLAATKLDVSAASAGVPRGDVSALAAKVRTLATRAVTLEDGDARAALYGELLSTCAGCHALVRPAPVP